MIKSIGQKPLVANRVLKNVYRTLEAALEHVEYELPESSGHLLQRPPKLTPKAGRTKRKCAVETSLCDSTDDISAQTAAPHMNLK